MTTPSASCSTDTLQDAPLRRARVVFDRYRLERLVGRGGMGVVWLARDEKLDRPVALKFLPEIFFLDPAARDNLKRETRRSLDLTHPHIVRIHDFVENEEMATIAMEYVDGPTLSQLRVQETARCFEPKDLAEWTAALCAALDYAHETVRCVHRDLKPGNIMVNSRGVLKVADFGIACTLHDTAGRVTSWTSTGGTLGYMSPQQLMGELPAPSDDVYAVGATLYELLTGTMPFFAGDLSLQIREVVPETITTRRRKFGLPTEGVPKAWEETIASCLAKDPRQRPASAGEIARRLELASVPSAEMNPRLRDEAPSAIDSDWTSVVLHPRRSPALDPIRKWTKSTVRFRWPIATACILCAAAPWISGLRVVKATKAEARPASQASNGQGEGLIPGLPPSATGATADQMALLAPIPARPIEGAESVTSAAARSPVQILTTPPGIPFRVLAGAFRSPTAEVLRSGETPAVLEGLAPGAYRVVFTPRGAAPRSAAIQVPSEGAVRLQQEFPHGLLKVRSQPDGAVVVCDGRELGPTPLEVACLPGRHEVSARWNGRDARTRPVSLADAAEQTVSFDFRTTSTPAKSKSRHAKKAEDDSVLEKVGRSVKNFFTGEKNGRCGIL